MTRIRPAAAAALLLALAGCTTRSAPADPEAAPPPEETAATTPSPAPLPPDGSIYFAADARAGRSLSGPVGFAEVEIRPQPMDIYLSRRAEPVRRVIATDAHERCPAVSPDGSRLAYLEDATVVIVPLDENGDPGAADVRVALDPQDLYAPSLYRERIHAGGACPQWSPDGRRLGYEVTLGDPGTLLHDTLTAEIHGVTLDGTDRVLASFATQVWHAEPDFAWSPDADAVAYTTVEGVWLAPLGHGAPQLVWRAPAGDLARIQALDYDRPISLAWSPEGALAFTVRGFEPTERGPMGGGRETRRVVVIDPGSGRVLLRAPAAETEGTGSELWSPDGSRLLFRSRDGRILLFEPASRTTVRVRPRLAAGSRVTFSDPTWSPDGRQLLVHARHDNRGFVLVSVPVDGSAGEVRTPWTWALDWTALDDVAWSAR